MPANFLGIGILVLANLLIGLAIPVTSRAQSTGEPTQSPLIVPLTDCDRLAADPTDPDKPQSTAGVGIGRIDIPAAVAACTSAIAAHPSTPRFRYQLGQAYFAARRFEVALEHYQAAADQGYVCAMDSMSRLHQRALGTGGSPDWQKAFIPAHIVPVQL